MTKARTLADNFAADINQVDASAPLTGGGTSGTVTVGIQDATTSQKGAVQLEDSTASTSTTKAATPNSVKSAYDLADGAIAKSLVDAKGDLLAASADNTLSRLAVGADNTVLTADSSTATGLKWAAAGGGALELIQRTSFSNVASQAFDDVFTTTYRAYKVVLEYVYAATGGDDLQMQYRYAGPSTETTGYYGPRFNLVYSGSLATASMNGTTQHNLMNSASTVSEPTTGTLEFYYVGHSSVRPQARAWLQSPYDGVIEHSMSWVTTSRIYTGFLLKSSSSNITGIVSVYGLATS